MIWVAGVVCVVVLGLLAAVALGHLWEPVRAAIVAFFDAFVQAATEIAEGTHATRTRIRERFRELTDEVRQGRSGLWKVAGALLFAPIFVVLVRVEFEVTTATLRSVGLAGELGTLSGFVVIGFTLVAGALLLDAIGVTHVLPVEPLRERHLTTLRVVAVGLFVFALTLGFALGYHRGTEAAAAAELPDPAQIAEQGAEGSDYLETLSSEEGATDSHQFEGIVSGAVTVMILLAGTLASWSVFYLLAFAWLLVLAVATAATVGTDLVARVGLAAAERAKSFAQAALFTVSEFGRKVWNGFCTTRFAQARGLRALQAPEPPVRLVADGRTGEELGHGSSDRRSGEDGTAPDQGVDVGSSTDTGVVNDAWGAEHVDGSRQENPVVHGDADPTEPVVPTEPGADWGW